MAAAVRTVSAATACLRRAACGPGGEEAPDVSPQEVVEQGGGGGGARLAQVARQVCGRAGKRPGNRAAGGGRRAAAAPSDERGPWQRPPVAAARRGGCQLELHNAMSARKACMLVCKVLGICCARLRGRRPAWPPRRRARRAGPRAAARQARERAASAARSAACRSVAESQAHVTKFGPSRDPGSCGVISAGVYIFLFRTLHPSPPSFLSLS